MEQPNGVCVSGLVGLRQAAFDRGRRGGNGPNHGFRVAAGPRGAFAQEQTGDDMIHR
jgi:hypothetical protein